jgi:hypothetical protein
MSSAGPERWILLGSVLAAAWLFTRPQTPRRAEVEGRPTQLAPALSALPPGAQVLARIDLTQVRKSALGAALTGGGRELSGLGSLGEICGFDPTEQIRELAIAMPESGAEPELGIVATGDFDADRIIGCVAKVITRRGGTPALSRIGDFASVRDRSRDGAEVAVRSGGPVMVGEGAYFRAMLDAADGRGPTLLGDEAHAALREAVAGHGAISLTFITRPGWLTRWVPQDEASEAPLGAVRAGALRIDLDPQPRATLLLSCPTPAACSELGKWTDQMATKARAALAIDPVSESKVDVDSAAVRLRIGFDPSKLQRALLSLLMEPASPDQ